MHIKFPYYNFVHKSARKWVVENDEKLADAVIAGENDFFLTPIVLTRMMGMAKTATACCERGESCGYIMPREQRLKDSGYLVQRKHRFIEAAIMDEWSNYFRNGRLVKANHVPNQRNLTLKERDTLIELLEANPDTKGLEMLIAKLKPEPVKGYKRKKDYRYDRR